MFQQTRSARQSRQNSVVALHQNNNQIPANYVPASVNQSQHIPNMSQHLASVSEYGTQMPKSTKDSRFQLRDNIIKNAAKANALQNNEDYLKRRKSLEAGSASSSIVKTNGLPTTTAQFIRRNIISRYQDQQNGSNSALVSQQLILQLLSKIKPDISQQHLEKLQNYILSGSFQSLITNKNKDSSQVARLINDVLGIQLSQESLNYLSNYITKVLDIDNNSGNNMSPLKQIDKNNQRNVMSVGKLDRIALTSSSLSELPYINKTTMSNSKQIPYNQKGDRCTSPATNSTTQSRITDITRSTAMSRPFTSLSYVSSTTIGTSLTQKIERLNKITIKSLAKQIIQCQHQIQNILSKNKLDLKSMLTISEIMLYFMQGNNTDLNLTLDQLNNVILAVMLIQPRADILISISSLLKACQLYIDQFDLEQKDFFNKSKMDKIMDSVRDILYNNSNNGNSKTELKQLFIKFSESDNDNYDRTVMTLENFGKLMRSLLSDKYSGREIEQLYRNLVSKKPLTYNRFTKVFTHDTQMTDQWFSVAIKQIRDYIVKKKMTSQQTFEKFLIILGTGASQEYSGGQPNNGRINKLQFREVMKRENLPFTMPQIDYIFARLDTKHDQYIDLEEWKVHIYDDFLNPLQMIREVVQEYDLTQADLLHKMKKKIRDQPMDFAQFKENMAAIDSSLSQLQLKSLFDSLKNQDGKVEYGTLMANLTGSPAETINYKKQTEQVISNYILENSLAQQFKEKFEAIDTNNEGKINNAQLLSIFKQLKVPLSQVDLERYIKMMEKDSKGKSGQNKFSYIDLMKKIENAKQNFPLKSIGMRLAIFLKQNNLTSKKLLEKLIATKNQSQDNQKRKKLGTNISTNFFAKFIKAKVDKKRSMEEIKQLVAEIDLDRDGIISSCDLEAFLGRIDFHGFFEKSHNDISYSSQSQTNIYVNRSTSDLMNKDRSISKTLYPSAKLNGEQLLELIRSIKNAIQNKNMSITEAFRRLDTQQTGLVSFQVFQQSIDQIISISQILKEKLFARMDTQSIGLISFQQFKQLIYQTNNSDILGQNENGGNEGEGKLNEVIDSFEWEQNTIKSIAEWIKVKNFSLSDAFKIIDQDFDGMISMSDLTNFLKNQLNIPEVQLQNTKIERLYKIMDNSKSGSIFQADFMTLFQGMHYKNINQTLQKIGGDSFSRDQQSRFSKSQDKNKSTQIQLATQIQQLDSEQLLDWRKSAIQQLKIYLTKHFMTVEDSFKEISTDRPTEESVVKISDFQQYVNKNNALKGFNLTQQLFQQLFAFMDPHKKGYLTLSDWQKTFQFGQENISLESIKRLIACSFASLEEAFGFFALMSSSQSHSASPQYSSYVSPRLNTKQVNFGGFCQVINQLLPKRYEDNQLKVVWGQFFDTNEISDRKTLQQNDFARIFGGLQYRAQSSHQDTLTKQIIKVQANRSSSVVSPLRIESNYSNLESLLPQQQLHNQKQVTTHNLGQGTTALLDPVAASLVSSNMLLDKLNRNLKIKGTSLRGLFESQQSSISDSCNVNVIEFRNALKKVYMSGQEIDKLLDIVTLSPDGSGLIDLDALFNKLQKSDKEEDLIEKRNQVRIDQLKQLMTEYMTSPEDAFKYFDSDSHGRLTYLNFQKLIAQLYSLAHRETPNYPIVKDLFDQIDIRKDNIIDINEWSKTFGISKKIASSQKSTIKVTKS